MTPSLQGVPGDGGLPLVGSTFDVLSGKLYNSRERYDRYGPVSWMRAFAQRYVTVVGPEAAGVVLQNRDRAFASGPGWSSLIGQFFHGGLMLLDFDEHHRHRRIMQQAFTAGRLAGYLEPMNRTLAEGLASPLNGPATATTCSAPCATRAQKRTAPASPTTRSSTT